MIVPAATPSSAVGNSINRSAYDNHETVPVGIVDAICVLISRLICAAETPNNAGAISLRTRRTFGSRHDVSQTK